jgi:hypothetical protein
VSSNGFPWFSFSETSVGHPTLAVVAEVVRSKIAGEAENQWAYSPEQMARIRQSLADIEAGRTYRLSEEDLLVIADRMDAARREGREYHPTDAELRAMEAKHLAPAE